MNTLSVIIITYNEQYDIGRCLEAIKWADEIIIFDSGSTDNTVNIAKKYTDKIFITDWPGQGIQKTRALNKATSSWVLSLDADEIVSEPLQQELKNLLENPQYDAYYIPFKSYFCGKLIKYGAWRNEKHLRLFNKDYGKFSTDPIHQKLIVTGKTGLLANHIIHYTYRNLNELAEKIADYSSQGANQLIANKRKGGLIRAILHGSWAFCNSYLLRFGVLDGKAGFLLAKSIAKTSFLKYLKAKTYIHQ